MLQEKVSFEILVMDDNSTDGTIKLVQTLHASLPQVRVVVRKKNRGLGNSIRDGVKIAQGSIIVGMDADFNHDPQTLPLLLHTLHHADLVVASRFIQGGGTSNIFRQVPTYMIACVFRLLGMPIWDNTSGYYAIKKSTLEKLGIDRIYYGYGDYHLRLVAFAHKAGLQITEVPTFYKKRLGGVSKSKLLNMFYRYFLEVIRLQNMA